MSTTPEVLQTDINEKHKDHCPNCQNKNIIFNS